MLRKPVAAPRVLVVEDDAKLRPACEHAMQLAGIEVLAAASAEHAKKILERNFSGVVVAGAQLSGMDGLQFLQFAQRLDPNLPVFLVTGHGDAAMAAEAMRLGADGVIEKPFSPERLVKIIQRALEKRQLLHDVEVLRSHLIHGGDIEARLIGESPQMEKVRGLILDLADADVHVLIVGEAGTGKALAARCLHDFSRRQAENFVALHCGAVSDTLLDSELFGEEPGTGAQKRWVGKIECANNGTLFLDDIEAIPASLQIKLLHVLKERLIPWPGANECVPVSLRLVAGSRIGPQAHTMQECFRSYLGNRRKVATIELPPLRGRREDIPALYDHFLLMAAKRYGMPARTVSTEEVRQLMAHDWPGNIRELRNHADCRTLGIACDTGTAEATPRARMTLNEAVETFERSLITAELERQSGNVARSSKALGVARTTLHDKMRKYGLNGTG